MPGVTYADYVHARLIVLWGVNPSASGIHLVPYINEARKAGATLVVVDPRATSLARQADLHIAPRPGTDLPLALALHRYLFDAGAPTRRSSPNMRAALRICARAPNEWTIDRAAGDRWHRRRRDLERFAELYRVGVAGARPMRLGARAESQRRQRRRGRARAAGGRRKVRRARRRILDEQLARASASRRRHG